MKNESAETPADTNTNQENRDVPEAVYVQEPLLPNPSGNYKYHTSTHFHLQVIQFFTAFKNECYIKEYITGLIQQSKADYIPGPNTVGLLASVCNLSCVF